MMNDMDFKDKITLYIDNELSQSDKTNFEEKLKKNETLKSLYDDIILNDNLIKEIPRIKTSSHFMLNLHNRIDDYNSKKSFSWTSIKDFIYNSKPVVGYSFASLVLILSIGIFICVSPKNSLTAALSGSSPSSIPPLGIDHIPA
mgnify:CR=1 FL=1